MTERPYRRLDLTNNRFNKLTVIERAESKNGRTQWLCKCDCGKQVIVATGHLRSGHTNSCGCYTIERIKECNSTHGQSNSESQYASEYNTWTGIRNRCYNSKEPAYKNYGGRGIKVCERWLKSFENFLEDMGPKPSPLHTLDRYPNKNGDYEPSNCRWATWKEQQGNRRNNRWIEYKGMRMIAKDWAIYLGTSHQSLYCMQKVKTFEEIYNYYTKKYKNAG